jgi:hypothetical protein
MEIIIVYSQCCTKHINIQSFLLKLQDLVHIVLKGLTTKETTEVVTKMNVAFDCLHT